MSVWLREGSLPALRAAGLCLDLDGVVVDVRASYRRSYLDGLEFHLRHDLGLPMPRQTLRAVHLCKRDPGFNAPSEVVALLLRLALLGMAPEPWIAAELAAGRLGQWRTTTVLPKHLQLLENPALALAHCREAYVGSAQVQALFGTPPRRRVQGLWRRDRLLLDPHRPPPARPVAVYTGRSLAETRWLLRRFRWFGDCPVQAVDTGARKPDGEPLRRLQAQTGCRALLYVGDLPADRDALLDARRRWPAVPWLLGQVLAEPRAQRWPEADVAATDVGALLDAIGA